MSVVVMWHMSTVNGKFSALLLLGRCVPGPADSQHQSQCHCSPIKGCLLSLWPCQRALTRSTIRPTLFDDQGRKRELGLKSARTKPVSPQREILEIQVVLEFSVC